jgi:hypothetical protein
MITHAVSRRTPTILVLLAGLAVSIAPAAAAQPASRGAPAAAVAAPAAGDELPIRRITLYRSGVGFFQRAGSVVGDARVQLRFKTDQVNDILKSLVLLDLSGGRIDAVSYASKDPLERRLASFGINIGDNPSAGEILNRLRGSPVRLVSQDGEVSGAIMNVERRPTVIPGAPGTPTAVHDLPWVNLITAKGVRSVNLTTVTGFEILDRNLADELNKALAALAEYRAESTKTVDLSFSGQGTRQVVVAYVHEMPVWKTTYRLVLPDEAGKSPTGTLHGWAVVENTTDQDWTDVRLALVAGRPVSFQMDLYEPLYTSRPTIPVPTMAGVMPRQYQEGVNEGLRVAMETAESRASSLTARPAARRAAPGAPPPAEPASKAGAGGRSPFRDGQLSERGDADARLGDVPMLDAAALSDYAAAAQGQAGSVGEVFQYELQTPVTIERQRSAMIPLISAPVQARRVSIFNLADRADHPMRGVELKNTSDLQLLPGPLAVFEGEGGAAYAGDATVGHIPAGDKRLVAYAVDLDVAALTKPESTTTVTRLRIVDGLFEQTVKQQNTVTYGFENKDTRRPRTILVEHPRLADWTLAEPKAPAETTQGLYRFELAVDAGKTGTLKVMQERIEAQRLQLLSLDLPTVLAYRQQGKLSEAVVNAFKEASQRQAAISQSEREIAEIDRQVKTISEDQARLRENMKTIDRTTDLYRRYATKLNDQETALEKLAADRAAAQKTLDDRRNDLANYLRSLNVE